MAILNETLKEKKKRADADDVKKAQFEKSMIRDLDSLFREISGDFKEVYASTGQVQSFRIYQDDMTSLLKKSYRKSSRWFSNSLKRELTKNFEDSIGTDNEEYAKTLLEERNKIEPDLISALLGAILIRTGQQARFILDTTEKVVGKNINKVIIESAEQGESKTNKEIAALAALLILKENVNRSPVIAQTEIQWASEGSKQAEGELLEDQLQREGVVDREGQTPFLEKTWITMGDKSVRQSHKDANGQTKPVKKPYTVQGQFLMRPGDTSLGATADNVINCRCVSVIG